MRRPATIAIRVCYMLAIVVLAFMLYPALRRAKVRGGPGPRAIIWTQLEMINDAKENLKNARHVSDDYWPTRAEIAAAYTGQTNRSFDDLFKPSRWGEVYIVNRVGAPVYAYLSNGVAGYPEGCLLTSRDLERPLEGTALMTNSAPEINPSSGATGSHR